MSECNSEKNRVVWLDMPVADLDRACAFYGAVLGIMVHREEYEQYQFAVLDHEDGNGGCLVLRPEDVTDKGPIVYFNVAGRIRDAVAQVPAKGGRVVEDVHPIGPYGFRAIVIDSEGNRLALHSQTDA